MKHAFAILVLLLVAASASAQQPELDAAWHHGSNNLVCLSVADEAELLELVRTAAAREVRCATFREPDFDGALTAVAFESAAKRFLSRLPLALRRPTPSPRQRPSAA